MYAYVESEQGVDLFTVGFCHPDGNFVPESDYTNVTKDIAVGMVYFLNGVMEKIMFLFNDY